MNSQSIEKDVVIVGAGFAGMYALYKMRELGLDAVVIERGDGVGGTWYWNRYPGARCDAESVFYSYSFSPELDQEWNWTERFPTQPEILSYQNHVADRFDLRRDIVFNTEVTQAVYDDAANRWTVCTQGGGEYSAQYCIMATGCLSTGRMPDFPGLESFTGEVYHTGSWPQDRTVDFTDKRVAVIGTGSSGIQCIPEIAKQAGHLTVFQRTPNFSVPARNAPLSEEYIREIKQQLPELREKARYSSNGAAYDLNPKSALEVAEEERQAVYAKHWEDGGPLYMAAFADLMVNEESNRTAVEFLHGKIDDIVQDPSTADLLKPTGYPMGSKRICVDTDYYATFNQPNVDLVDVKSSPIQELTPKGIRTAAQEYAFDVIVFATGFDAMTGALLKIDIRGAQGLSLRQKWSEGPKSYLGVAIAGFPNLFTITGPGSPSVISNVVASIEQHVEWISDHLEYLQFNGLQRSEAQSEAEDAWVAHVNEVADQTLFPKANSWYVGANVPGKPRVFMPYVGGVGPYRMKCDEIAANGYEGFALSMSTPAPSLTH